MGAGGAGMRNTANTSSAAALIPSMAELVIKDRRRHSSDSEPVGLNDAERVVSIDDG